MITSSGSGFAGIALGGATVSNGITNAGTISATQGAGILLAQHTTTASVVVKSFVTSGSIVNQGTITAKGGIIIGDSTVDGAIVNSNTGMITSAGSGFAGIALGGATVSNGITNAGTITDTQGAGILLAQYTTNSSVVVQSSVTSGGIVNQGTITAKAGIIITDSTVDGAIVNGNTGMITSSGSGFAGIAMLGATVSNGITNAGTISATQGAGILVAQYTTATSVVVQSSVTSGGIVNQGTITAATGIAIADSTVNGAIVNSGNITGTTAAIDASGASTAVTIDQNGGTITGAIKLSANADILAVTGGAIAGNIVGEGSSDTVDFALGAGNTFTYSNTISGVNAVNANTGTVLLQGTINSSNLTIAAAGTLLVGTGGNVVPSVTDNGVFGFEQSGTYTYAGAISGSGVVEQTGTGTTVLTAADDSGNTTISSGTLDVGVGGSVSGNVRFTGNNSTLELATGPSQVGGYILGAKGGDGILLTFQAFASGDHMVWTQQTADTGTLALVNSGGTTLQTLNLQGEYTSSDFSVTSSGGNALIQEVANWFQIDGGTPVAMAGGDFQGLGSAQIAASYAGAATYLWSAGTWTKIDGGVYSLMAPANFYGTSNGNNNNIDLAAYDPGVGTYIWRANAGWAKIDGGTVTAISSGNFSGSGAELIASDAAAGAGTGTFTWSPSAGWTRIDGGVYTLMAAGDFYGTTNGNGNHSDVAAFDPGVGTYIWSASGGWSKIDSGAASAYAAGNFLGTSNGNNNQTDLAAYFAGAGTYIWSAAAGWNKIDSGAASGLAAVDLNGNGHNELLAYFPGAGMSGRMYEWQNGVGWNTYDSTSALPASAPQALFATGNFQGGSVVDAAAAFTGANHGIWLDPPAGATSSGSSAQSNASSVAAPTPVAFDNTSNADINTASAAAARFIGASATPQLDQAAFATPIAGSSETQQPDLSAAFVPAPVTVDNGASVDINTASAVAATFVGSSGTLQLDQSAYFTGAIAGFTGQDQLDLTDIAYSANTTLGYVANSANSSGTLTVSDGVNTANIALLGSYMASTFVTSSDGHGGTLVSEAAQMSAQATPLAQPHTAV
jgi:hypothetical protein